MPDREASRRKAKEERKLMSEIIITVGSIKKNKDIMRYKDKIF